MPVGGGSVTVLVSGQIDPFSLAVDNANVYWTEYNGYTGGISSVPIAGGSVALFALT
ncbi:MAG: hypothetical protein LVQ95_05460 [Candidatus Micrarchaeales archaeon]|nr:hypothetical protein [Candidatus Micrarchaeales archaeon]